MKYIIAIDLGGTKILSALFNQKLDVLNQVKLETQVDMGMEHVINRIAESAFRLIEAKNLKKSQILGIGLGSPGPIDTKKGIIHLAPNLKCLHNVRIKDRLQEKIKLPVLLENDANLAALGEQRKGAGKKAKNLLCVTLGTGVGGGLILDGELYRGTEDGAGEVGYIVLYPDEPNGYLEKYSSATAIVNHFKRALENGERTSLTKEITSKNIYESALKGDKLSKKIMTRAGKCLGIGLATIVNLLNLEMIVVGGNVAEAGEMILGPAREELLKRALYPANKVKVVKAKLGTNAGVIGAAILAYEYFR